jgi:hypothetical protein
MSQIKGVKDTSVSMSGSTKPNEPNVFKDECAIPINLKVVSVADEIDTPAIFDNPINKLNYKIASDYYWSTGTPLNIVSQESKFDNGVFTVNADKLMANFKEFGTPIMPISDYTILMDDTKPFNITKYQPNAGKFILLGITGISPLILSGISNAKGPDVDKYTDPYKYFIIGVPNKEFNHRFGMKAMFKLQQVSPGVYNGSAISNDEDPLSGFNLKKTFTDIKSEIMKDKDGAAKERIAVRTLLLVDEMDIDGYTY